MLTDDEIKRIGIEVGFSPVVSLECWVQALVLDLVRQGALRLLDATVPNDPVGYVTIDGLVRHDPRPRSRIALRLRITGPRTVGRPALAVCEVARITSHNVEVLYTTSQVPVLQRPWGLASCIALWLRQQIGDTADPASLEVEVP